VILTFDDGPSEWTPAILDLLAEHKRKATFFVIGRNALEHPHTLRRIARDGHDVGIHTWSHRHLLTCNAWEAFAELWACDQLLDQLLDAHLMIWRAPFLDPGPNGTWAAEEVGLIHIDGDVSPDDFARDDPEEIARVVLSEATADSVVILHDGVPPDGGSARCLPSRAPTVEALRRILEATS
jgi:peptidoglycan/xylan/chitin deacetylase (PgdA/CDA1 family)